MRVMMIKMLMILLVSNIACVGQISRLIDTKNLKSVAVSYVYLRTTTPISIDCDVFSESFDDIKSKTLISESEWTDLINEINRLIENGQTMDERPDVRMTITLNYNDKSIIICVGNNLTSVNGANFVNDGLFREFILSHFKA